MSERRRARYAPPQALVASDPPGPFVPAEWMPLVDADVDPPLRRVYARRAYDDAMKDWGRRNGYDPDAKYTEPEGRRWHDFRHGPRREATQEAGR